MTSQVFHLSTDTIDEQFLESLKEQYPHAALKIEVGPRTDDEGLTEDEFWTMIELLDWSKEGNNDAVLEPLVQQLAAMPPRYIYEFQDMLSSKLYALDTRLHAENSGENAYQDDPEAFFSVDEFLYARCCVVANGRQYYEEVQQHPESMPKDLAFGALLRAAGMAYQRKTGKQFRYVPAFNVETFSNKEGWKL